MWGHGVLSLATLLTLIFAAPGDCSTGKPVKLPDANCHRIVENEVYKVHCKTGTDESDILPPPQTSSFQNDMDSSSYPPDDGDILYSEDPHDTPTTGNSRRKRKINGSTWPRNIVPWEIDSTLPKYAQSSVDKIKEAMTWWEKNTCIRFIPASRNPSARSGKILSIKNEKSCASYVGYQTMLPGSKQAIRLLESSCFSKVGTAAHELGHALGLIHEHTRPDRDEHVNILANRLSSLSMHNFEKIHESSVQTSVNYDLNSIMHYRPTSFSIDGSNPVIVSKDLRKQGLMGQREALSFYDIKAVNINYRCRGNCNNRCDNEGYAFNNNGRCVCLCPEGLSGPSCNKVDSTCGGVVYVSPGRTSVVSSPSYPRVPSYSYDKCIWLIQAPTGYNIDIKFEQFDIAKSKKSIYEGAKCIHHVEVRSNMLGQRGDTYCGKGPISPINTEMGVIKNKMMVVLDMKERGTRGRGFSASVTAYRDGCLSNPCHHGATCVSQRTSSFTCRCPEGYTGRLCDVITDGGISCGFGEDMCGLVNSARDQLDFHREFRVYKYKELVERYSNGNKYFLAAPVEFSTQPGSEARLLTPTFNASARSRRCLSFYYKIDGSWQRGVLTVNLIHPTTSRRISTLMVLNNNQGNGWRSATKEISETRDYKVEFVVRTGTLRYNSLIALDDVKVLPQSCYSSPCSSRPCYGEGSVCVELSSSNYKCICPPGLTGTRCDKYNTNGFMCNFDSEKLCGWTQDKVDSFDWIRTHGASDALERTGPTTSAVGYGYYLVADTSASTAQVGTSARIMSPNLKFTGSICVSFYYHMHGHNVGSLHLKTSVNNRLGSFSYFHKSGSQSTQWRQEQVTINIRDYNTKLVFEATVGTRHLADIAVDDIKITRGSCNQPTSRVSQTTSRSTTLSAPTSASSSASRPASSSASTSSSTTSRTSPRTTSPRTTSLSTTTRTSPRPFISRSSSSSLQTIINRVQNSASGVLVNCDFERDLCRQYLTITDRYRMIFRTNRRTPSWNTGPSAASEGQYFIFLEGSVPSAPFGSQAKLETPSLGYSGEICISFDYHMYGAGIGMLEVFVDKGGSQQLLWRKSGQKGSSWLNAKINLRIYRTDKVLFTMVKGRNVWSDVALDNLKISRGSCSSSRTINTLTRYNYSCDFEGEGMCDFVNSDDDSADWTINSGPTRSVGTGPETAAAGKKYLYVEASYPVKPGSNAKLISPKISSGAGDVCLEFNYHLNGISIGKLTVYQKFTDDDTTKMILLRDSRDKDEKWRKMRTLLKSSEKPFEIIFEAKTGVGSTYWSSDIALDDILIYSGRCN